MVNLVKHKSDSRAALAKLLATASADFDVVYVDGSHEATDVLTDAVMSFHLLRVGGLIIFDDYLWSMNPVGQQDAFGMPKPAIDAFINIFQRKLYVIPGPPIYQLFATKAFV